MWEAAKSDDYTAVCFCPFHELWIIERGHQCDASRLRFSILRMLKRQIKEPSLIFAQRNVEASGDCCLRYGECPPICGKGVRRIAEHVAGHLIKDNDSRQRGPGIGEEKVVVTCRERFVYRAEAPTHSV